MSLLDEPFSLNVGAMDLQLGHFTYQFLLLLLLFFFFFFWGGGGYRIILLHLSYKHSK